MISPEEALQFVVKAARPLSAEERPLLDAAGFVLAEPVAADRDQPPFNRAMMDGYAVPGEAAGRALPVVGQIAAGGESQVPLQTDQCMEIMTGAPCPTGTVAVVPREQTQRDEERVVLPATIEPGQFIAPRGSEHPQGAVVLRRDARIDALAVAVLASVGRSSVRVVRKPFVAIVTTGAEVVPPDLIPAPTQIRDGNGPMLHTMARQAGIEVLTLEHAEDRLDAIGQCLRRRADADILILTGGVSAGRFDFVPDAVRQAGADIVFHRVRQKPGKPLLFARRERQLIFGLPGNPLACHLCFHRYVAAAIRQMQGQEPERPVRYGRLTNPVQRNPDRDSFILGAIDGTNESQGPPRIRPLPGKTSADVFRAINPNCYVHVASGTGEVSAGETVTYTRLDGAEN